MKRNHDVRPYSPAAGSQETIIIGAGSGGAPAGEGTGFAIHSEGIGGAISTDTMGIDTN